MKKFQSELGKMGYKFQFNTLAGFHLNNYATFKLAQAYKKDGMFSHFGHSDRNWEKVEDI